MELMDGRNLNYALGPARPVLMVLGILPGVHPPRPLEAGTREASEDLKANPSPVLSWE